MTCSNGLTQGRIDLIEFIDFRCNVWFLIRLSFFFRRLGFARTDSSDTTVDAAFGVGIGGDFSGASWGVGRVMPGG